MNLIPWLLLPMWCDAFRVLVVFPLAGKSHSILGEGYVRRLLDAGHEVTYIAGVPSTISSPKLRQIDVSSNKKFMGVISLDVKNFIKEKTVISFNSELATLMMHLANATISNEEVQKLMEDPKEEFDVIVIEFLFSELYTGLASVFNCPYIWSSSLEPHGAALSLIDDDPNPAYVPDIMSSTIPPFTFVERVVELWKVAKAKYIKWRQSFEEEVLFEQLYGPVTVKRGRKLASLTEMRYNASLMLGNSHISAGQATRLPQNYVAIAGYHIQDTVKPLPEDLQRIMDDAKNGVIYFSMGSMIQSKTMPVEVKTGLLNLFGRLKQTVIWKLEEVPNNTPKNVHFVSFAPQQSILAHPNCILFITHGGLLSTTEAIHYGVPIIGIPTFGDQFININRAVHKGFAKRIALDYDIPVNLEAAVKEMLGNPSYRDRVKELSFIYHDRVVPPSQELVHWVEHVVKTRGAPHLRSPALMLPWYQKMYLDLALLLFTIVILSLMALKRLLSPKRIVKMKRN